MTNKSVICIYREASEDTSVLQLKSSSCLLKNMYNDKNVSNIEIKGKLKKLNYKGDFSI